MLAHPVLYRRVPLKKRPSNCLRGFLVSVLVYFTAATDTREQNIRASDALDSTRSAIVTKNWGPAIPLEPPREGLKAAIKRLQSYTLERDS